MPGWPSDDIGNRTWRAPKYGYGIFSNTNESISHVTTADSLGNQELTGKRETGWDTNVLTNTTI